MTKGIKSLFTHIKVKNEEFDNKWEESVSNWFNRNDTVIKFGKTS
jgi:hypothetical protein